MKKIIITEFTTLLILLLCSVGFVNHFYAVRSLQNDADQLLYQLHDALTESHAVLKSLSGSMGDECDATAKGRTSTLTYSHPSVRFLGFLDSNGSLCTDDTHQNKLIDHQSASHHALSESLLLSQASTDGKLDLLMILEQNGKRYISSINPFMVDNLAEFACTDCLQYSFTIRGNPDLKFNSPTMGSASFIDYQTARNEMGLSVGLQVSASREFYNYYKELSWLSTLILSVLISALVTYLTYKVLVYRLSLGRVITSALEDNEFVPYYQPIVDSRNGQVVGAELLARWQTRQGKLIPPYQFIPYAEDSGLIIDITNQLLEKAAADIVDLGWASSGQFVSVNLVADHLQDDTLFEFIDALLEKNQLAPSAISLEITERNQIDDLQSARTHLDKFYDRGINLKLDDAGTGYGGFSYVQELGVNTLKIDKMFVDTIGRDDIKGSVLDAIIAFAQSSGLHMIAEGVEDQHQVDYLKERDVYLIQGYVYGKPMPIKEFKTWLNKN
ncbi:MAG: EAL domain-containing protein [Candidatus Pelagadaptatus aseana]|uniref:EAL domain-containing protein n=1 Tax=Candidatus Pelagadaptatus aseana TaxID=3120508 RepID=UPI0039B36398